MGWLLSRAPRCESRVEALELRLDLLVAGQQLAVLAQGGRVARELVVHLRRVYLRVKPTLRTPPYKDPADLTATLASHQATAA